MNFRLLSFIAIVFFTGPGAVGRAVADASAAVPGPGLQAPGSGGAVAALACRVRTGQHSTVFTGGQNGSPGEPVDFARKTDVLVMHPAVSENIGATGRKLHAPPSVIGKIAAKTGAGALVPGHFMARSLVDGEENLKHIRSRYDGPVLYADDLVCINI